jgi:protein-S-isoprenylcysteine O-methyltransferase Ste14
MSRVVCFAYGVFAYVVFLVAFLYAIGFVEGYIVPKAMNDGAAGPVGQAILVNVLLLAAFAIQHTIMARPAFKRWFTKIVPAAVERSTFVLVASTLLLLLFWRWRPMPEVVWQLDQPAIRAALIGISFVGWGIVLYGTFIIDHFDLFGLRQVYFHLRGIPYEHVPFIERSLYRLIRHPLMAGFIIAFWATPDMTRGHLLFAAMTTVYTVLAIHLEERDLAAHFGDDYARYRERTSMLLPIPGRRGRRTGGTR